MTRKIICTESTPFKLEIGDEVKYICQCGLSKRKPFCDGAHVKTADEDPDKVYEYDAEGNRKEI